MPTPWSTAGASLDANIESVFQLLDFDRVIIDVAVDGLKGLEAELETKNLHNPVRLVANRRRMLANLATNESLRPQYETMFNQCVVLLVSYFGSGVHTLFRAGVVTALRSGADLPVDREALTVSWHGLERAEGEREAIFADLLVAQKDISFQDMKSIGRAFGELLEVTIERGGDVNNIILGQAARHAIVHAGGIVDRRMVKQLSGVLPRTLKAKVVAGESLRFTPPEVRELAKSMRAYVRNLGQALDRTFGSVETGSA